MNFQRTKQTLVLALLVLMLVACNGTAEEPTATPEVVVVVVTATDEPVVEEAAETAPASVFVTMIQDLNMRAGDSTSHGIMTVVPGGTSVEVLGKNSAGTWYQINYNDNIGWVSVAYTEGEVPGDLPVVQAPPAGSSGGSGGSGGSSPTSTASSGGGGASPTNTSSAQVAPSDSDLVVDVNIKSHTSSHQGVISYPDGDSMDRVHVNVSGFDSVTTSGDVQFTLTCSGPGLGDVIVMEGSTSRACNSTWTNFFTNVSNSRQLTIKLESGSGAYVNWTLILSANN
jgi:hypothetical protein